VAKESEALGGAPLVIVHTGDAEAYGSETNRFRAYELLESQLWPALRSRGAADVVEVYGNHDVWSGTLALFDPFGHGDQLNALRATVPDFRPDWPTEPTIVAGNGSDAAFIRVNTVRLDAVRGGLFAKGRVSSHPPSSGLTIEQLIPPADASLRILVTHHPPHHFEKDRDNRGTFEKARDAVAGVIRRIASQEDPHDSQLTGATELADVATMRHIQLCLSGHRHALNPGHRQRISVLDRTQMPLGAATAQLVAQSPTQIHDEQLNISVEPNSFSVYHVLREESGDTVEIERRRYVYDPSSGFGPRPDHVERRLICDIPLA
jgi:hypothetical protein